MQISNKKQVCHFYREHVHFGLFEGGLGTSVLRTQKRDIFLDDVLLIFKLKTITAMAALKKCP